MKMLLRDAGYVRRYIGPWKVFVTPAARQRARQVNVRLSEFPEPVALNRQHKPLPPKVPCPLVHRAPAAAEKNLVAGVTRTRNR